MSLRKGINWFILRSLEGTLSTKGYLEIWLSFSVWMINISKYDYDEYA